MSDWSEVYLDDVCSKITDGSHQSPKELNGGFPMFSVKDMEDFGFNYTKVKKISKSDYDTLVNQGCQPYIGDVLIAKDGSVLKHIFFVKNKPDYVLLSSIAILRPIMGKVDPQFLVYAIKHPLVYDLILTNFVSGSGVPRIVLKDFKKVQILFPPLVEQKAVAEVLSSLDDKIDLLHRNNKTLESLAETLFRHRFIERANDSWEEKSLDKIAEFLNGLALQKFPVQPGQATLPVIKIREMNQGITKNTDLCSASLPEKYIVKNGDILFSWSGSLDVIIWTGGNGALNQHLFKVTSLQYPSWLIYFATRIFLPEFRDIANDKATTMGHIQRGHLAQSLLKLPPISEIKKHDDEISPLFNKLIANHLQIHKLVALRDMLLPKLMSGSVKVNNLVTA